MQLSSLKSISLSIIIMVYIKNMNQKKFFFFNKKNRNFEISTSIQ